MARPVNANRKCDELVVFHSARKHSTLLPHWRPRMTTPTITSLAPLLDRLYDEAKTASGAMRAAVADLSDADRARMMRSKTDYRDLYGRLKEVPLAVSRETGSLLYML